MKFRDILKIRDTLDALESYLDGDPETDKRLRKNIEDCMDIIYQVECDQFIKYLI